MLKAGSGLPDFALADDRGETVTRDGLAGRRFVLFFYPKDDSSGCTQEAVAFSGLHDQFQAAGVAVFGVSPDSVKAHAKFRDKHGLTVPLLSDPERRLIEPAGLWIEKTMYGRRYMGVDRTTILVDTQGVVATVWPSVKIPGHAEAVLVAAVRSTE